jgi:dihydrodipicolinate synthase/N-acetylneuraminate lyase
MAPDDVIRSRRELLARLFPAGVPRLWCPTLTHVRGPREPDPDRVRRHMLTLAPHVGGILVPGSTGEGWEMSDADVATVLGVALDAATATGVKVLVGVLKTTVPEMLACLDGTLKQLRQRTGATDDAAAMTAANVVGFTVCPPKGADLGQPEIEAGLAAVLDRGWPTALYQLPQVTGNEMAPETVARLAARYPNFVLFKDTSGADRVASSGVDLGGVFLVRGAEGDYARWPRSAGGPYDGFLLSTANVFALQLAAVIDLLAQGRKAEAEELAGRVSGVVRAAFEMVAWFPAGNPFAIANKSLDHVMAHGPAAVDREPPLLFGGTRLPPEFVAGAADLLRDSHLMPAAGYLERA